MSLLFNMPSRLVTAFLPRSKCLLILWLQSPSAMIVEPKKIESVVSQDYTEIEYLIVDGKSTDRTLEIVNRYQNVPYIRVISEKDSGLYNAMNKGADLATGDYILYLNSGESSFVRT